MYHFLVTLIEKCEIGVRKDAKGWHLSAKGALGVSVVLVFILFVARVL